MTAAAKVSFEHLVAGVIVANAALVVAAWWWTGHEAMLETAHDACLAFFVVELALRLRRSGLGFFRGRWNCFDGVVIALAVLPVLGTDASLLRLARLARLVHLMRHLTHLRLVRLVRVHAMGA